MTKPNIQKVIKHFILLLIVFISCKSVKQLESSIDKNDIYEPCLNYQYNLFHKSYLKTDSITYINNKDYSKKILAKVFDSIKMIESLNNIWKSDTLNAFVFQTIYFMDSTKQQILYVNIMKKELVADVLLKDKQSLNNSINFLRHCRGDRFEVYYNIKNDKIEKYNIFW